MSETAAVEAPPQRKFGGPQEGSGPKKGTVYPSKLLLAMRHVFENESAKDETEGQKKCRAFYEKEPSKFLERLNQLEVQHRRLNQESQGRYSQNFETEDDPDAAVPATEKDEGEERIFELIALLEREMEK